MRARRPRAREPAFKRLLIDSLPRGARAVGCSGAGFFRASIALAKTGSADWTDKIPQITGL